MRRDDAEGDEDSAERRRHRMRLQRGLKPVYRLDDMIAVTIARIASGSRSG